jgi:hypothetical protein
VLVVKEINFINIIYTIRISEKATELADYEIVHTFLDILNRPIQVG